MFKNERVLYILNNGGNLDISIGLSDGVFIGYNGLSRKKRLTFMRQMCCFYNAKRFCFASVRVYSIFIIAQIPQMLPRDIGNINIILLPISPEAFGEFWSIIKMNFIDYFYLFIF